MGFAFAPLTTRTEQKAALRITARGFTNLRGGHRRLRLCFFATAVTDERVAEGQATTNGRSAA